MTSTVHVPRWAAVVSQELQELIYSYGWTALALSLSIILVAFSLRQGRVVKVRKPQLTDKRIVSTMSGASVSQKTPPLPGHVSVSKILIHPIKSCRGVSVDSAKYTHEGLENDRLWCIIDAVKVLVITAREMPKMILITPRIGTDGTLNVTFPEDSGCEPFSVPLHPTEGVLKSWTILPKITLWPTHEPVDGYICESIEEPHLSPSESLSKYFGKPVHLVYKGPQPRTIDATTSFPTLKATAKYQDMYPLLILSEESTQAVDAELRGRVGTQGIEERWKTENVPIERFRPNIIITGGGPFAEDQWEEISIGAEGAPAITLVSKCTRCLLPNVDPQTGERDKAVPFKVLMKFRTGLDAAQPSKPCVGCNGVPAGDGVVKVGDWVYVKKMI